MILVGPLPLVAQFTARLRIVAGNLWAWPLPYVGVFVLAPALCAGLLYARSLLWEGCMKRLTAEERLELRLELRLVRAELRSDEVLRVQAEARERAVETRGRLRGGWRD